ncbi:SAM--benzoic acid carboxyl methyltransferase [Enterococcus faecalis]|nr:SAM--benzoic acid carboxyl methyltransferase [Enterococcus faecalis]
MPPEDYQAPFCFECDGELLELRNILTCEECGKIYSQDEYKKLTDAEAEKYIDFMKKKTPELFS